MKHQYPRTFTSVSKTFLRIGTAVTLMTAPLAVLNAVPASAAPGDGADVDIIGNTVTIGDEIGGGGNGQRHSKDPNYVTVERFPDRPCVDRNNNVSYYGIVQRHDGSDRHEVCLLNHYGGGTDVTGFVKKSVPAPRPRADFHGDFLTGAPIQFRSTDLRDYTVNLPGFPGAYAVITALDITWDFGDGTTSKDFEPIHTYENIAPDPDNTDLHKVYVTVTGTWHVVFHDPILGDVVDYGNITASNSLDRSIDQVWSKQMEPNS